MIQKSMFPLAFCGNEDIDSYVRKYFVILFIIQLFSKYAVNAVIAVNNEILLIFLTVSIVFLPTAAVIYSDHHLPRVSGELFLQTS